MLSRPASGEAEGGDRVRPAGEAAEACTVGAQKLRLRLQAMRDLGAAALHGRDLEGGVHRLRFRRDEGTEGELGRIVAEEREACPQLELTLTQAGGELILWIAALSGGQDAADQLADAFERGLGAMPSFRPIPIEPFQSE